MEIAKIDDNVLKNLFENLCEHGPEYKNEDDNFDWARCNDCPLSGIKSDVEHQNGPIERDLCFKIWHGNELE